MLSTICFNDLTHKQTILHQYT